ncbi:RloB family protein [Clostridium sartagoforme]|uniref:Abortive phage resistance protein n=1 Tax=Clostridium sartagoforme AAU1 TaxID=1202534 RepID=R9BTU8_9CLOT|nr:RloB family protein [Clostridium sartagoforme]EOR20427.1 hypothetical protein A500_17390 [Clostridium sartagoforme AAU1]
MRIPKKYGERTLHFKSEQIEKPKYIFVYEGQETEAQYFQGIIDNRGILNINPLIDLQPILRSHLELTKSHPVNILSYLERYLENYYSIDMISNKIVDFCIEILDVKDNSIYTSKMLNEDIIRYLCYISEKDTNEIINFTSETLIGLAKYLEDKIQLTDQIDSIIEYIEDQEIVYNKDIDKICLIIDRDCGNVKPNQYDLILEKCRNKGINLYVTNPNFEFWLYLHTREVLFEDHIDLLENRRTGKKRYLERRLSDAFEGYRKDYIKFDRFLPKLDIAIEQEKQFCEDLIGLKTELGSNVGILISQLKNK